MSTQCQCVCLNFLLSLVLISLRLSVWYSYVVDRRIHAEMERFIANNNAMVKGLLLQYARIRTLELNNEAKVWRSFVTNLSNVQTTKPPE